jgi:hypothetical protein
LSSLPRVSESTRERISREFDNLGPDACVAEITVGMRRNNPELLDMARRCAADIGPEGGGQGEVMVGFAMFYRLLAAEAASDLALPRVTPQTRGRIVQDIEQRGSEAFTYDALAQMERGNPELLQMAHGFATRQSHYLAMMQGLALVYASLIAQAADDRAVLH